MLGAHLHARGLAQGFKQGRVDGMAGHQLRWHGLTDVVLGDEGLEHRRLGAARRVQHRLVIRQGGLGLRPNRDVNFAEQGRSFVDMAGEVGAVSQMAAAAHHGQVDAGAPARHFDRQYVDILVHRRQAAGVHRLLVLHAGQCGDAVAQRGRLFVLQRLGVPHHLDLQVANDLLRFTQQKALDVAHVAPIVGGADLAYAGARAAVDLVQQAGPRAVAENRVLAGAQLEQLLHQLDRLLDRPGVGIGPKVAVLAVDGTTKVGHPRIGVVDDLQVRVALVVAEQDVVARRQRLDEVVLQQQGLGLAAHHRGLEPGDARHHLANARAVMVALQVAGHAPLEAARLADIEHLILGVDPAVHARQRRQARHLGQQLFALEIGHARVAGGCGRGRG